MKLNTRKTIVFGLMLVLMTAHAAADVRVDSVSLDPTQIDPGNEVNVYVKLNKQLDRREVYGGAERVGSKTVLRDDPNVFYMAKLVAKDSAASKYLIILDGEKNIGHLFDGESWTTPFKIRVSADAPPADYGMEYQLIETDADYKTRGDVKSYEFNVPVKGTVKFSISSNAALTLGETDTLALTIENVGGGNARQVSVDLNASSPFTILASSEAYAGDMAGITSKSLSYVISVASSAKPGAYEIPMIVKYVNSTGSEVEIKKTLGVEVAGEPDINVMLDSADLLKTGGKGEVTLQVINKGFIDAKFLNLQLVSTSDYTVDEPSKVYIGNLASDDFESQEFTIKVNDGVQDGAIPLAAVVEYRKENSNKVERLEAAVNVNVLSDAEYASKMKSNGGMGAVSIVLAIPALIVAYLILWLIVKIVGVITTFLNRRLFKRGVQ